ncbi:hypothetical protein C8J57DRAFT_1480776 [Mycena rebaudengoi]|nr:hypothetical protein C8J57DRAFT_1480776 [Mycena rebaudengoi]
MTTLQPTPIAVTSTAGATATSPDWLVSLILMANEITAATELMSSPYLKGAVGHIVPILEAVQKMTRNREDFQELCEIIVKFANVLLETISRHGIATRPSAQQICEELERLLQEIRQKLTEQKKGLRHRLKEFGKSTSIRDDLSRYKTQLEKLRTDFILMSVAQLNINATGPITQPPPAPVMTVCPPPSHIFHGQRDILDKMHHYFAQDVGNRHVCLLYGLGGSGKTQIALKFLDETSSDRFTNIFFLDASSADMIMARLENIAVTRSIGSDYVDALHWLASCQEEWMIIFDNADDPKLDLFTFFPQGTHGNILITSRNPRLRVLALDAHYRISDLEEEAAVQLLLVSAAEPVTSENEMFATEIVKALHCLPLAVAQAGAYIAKTGALQKYLALYEQNSAQLLGYASSQSHDKYALSVYTTWDIGFRHLSQQAAKFLQLCSFLHYEGISEAIFSNAATFVPYPLGPTDEQVNQLRQFLSQFLTPAGLWDPLCFSQITIELEAYSLIDQDPMTQLFSIHPLVHSWSRTTVLDIDLTRECAAALLAMSVSQEDQLFTMRLLPHINTVLQTDSQLATKFLYPYCQVYYETGNFQRAQELCEQLVENVRFTLGAEHSDTLIAMAYLATIYQHLGKLEDAEELQVVVLERRRQILGSEHPDTLTAMANLATIYQHLGKLADAEELQVVVLERRRQILGSEHPDTLTAMANMATIYQHLGKLADAEELQMAVLENRRQILGSEHPDTLTAMANMATIYQHLGKLADAEELQMVVLERRKQILGSEHPDTLTAMANMATIYQHLGKLADAEELQVVVLERRKQILGSEHPDTLTAMANMATIYQHLGKLADAEELQVVVLERRRQILGSEHPDTLTAMANIATIYQHLGKLADTEELQVVVLERRRQILGSEHPDTLTAMANMATIYQHLRKLADAEELQMVVLENRRQILGSEHPDTLTAMANLANTYRALGKLPDAEELEVVLLEKRRQIFGPEHPDTLTAMENLANTYRDLRKLTEAEELELIVLEKRRQILGPDHPETLAAMANLANTYQDLAKLTEAEELEVVVLEKRRQILGPDHPETLAAMENLAKTYRGLGKLTQAEELKVAVL